MNKFVSYSRPLPWFMSLLLSALLTGCGGSAQGSDPTPGIVGNTAPAPSVAAVVAPTVTAAVAFNNATGVPINNTMISVAFSEPMAPITSGASFAVTCAAPCENPAGTVALDATNRIATFTLAGGNKFAPLTLYTATLTGARSLATGLALAIPYVWQFTTGIAPDTTRPRVMFTVPATTVPGPTAAMSTMPINAAITAIFTEDMAPATIAAANFKVTCLAPCVSPAGNVSYAVGSRTAVFTPAAVLREGAIYTATITTAATDLAGNALSGNQTPLPAASNYVWTFAAAAPVPPANFSVLPTSPVAGAVGMCPGATINATFSVPSGLGLDPLTVNSSTVTVTGLLPALTPVTASSVVLDVATGRIATFTPISALTAGTIYTATIRGGASGVRDLAIPANTMPGDVTWNFTAGPSIGNCAVPVALGAIQSFGSFGGSVGTINSGILTLINGDIGTTAVSDAVTGFHDTGPGCTYTETPLNNGMVNGKIYTAAPPPTVACPDKENAAALAIAPRARADALAAYNALRAQPAGPDPGEGNLANRVLTPGVYTAASGSFRIQGGNLTLDAKGNANAVWVFQMANSLTVGGPGPAFPQSIVLVNGAQHKNVFWQVGSVATINAAGGGTMVGTIISQEGAVFSTPSNTTKLTLNGRVLSLGAPVTMVNTVINVPAP